MESEVADKRIIKDSLVVLKVAFVQASPLAYRPFVFLFGEYKVGQIVVTMKGVADACFLVCDVFR